MDVFEQLLVSGSPKTVNAETLEYIGQRAANEFLEKKASLNQAIVKLASSNPDLNNEHIHRIAEFANNATFQQLFEKNKDKNVHFDVADPGVIIRDLRDGGSPAHSGKVLHNKEDYYRPPLREEKDGSMGTDGSGVSDPESGIADLFRRENSSGQFGQGEPIQKLASVEVGPEWEGSANPVNDIYTEHQKLSRARDELLVAHESADLALQNASSDFYKLAREEVLAPDGAGFRGVLEAFSRIAGDPSPAQVSKIAGKLMLTGVTADQLRAGIEKSAGKVLNSNHPLVKAAAGLVACSEARLISKAALTEVEQGLEKTSSFLKKAAKK